MRPLVSWMTKSDDTILELLNETGIALPPAVIAYNTPISHPTVRRRLPKLLGSGLVCKADTERGYYAISEKGREYLSGSLEVGDLERVGEK